MPIFDNRFGDSGKSESQNTTLNWNDLTTIGQLDEIVTDSFEHPALIFKHSTRCGISRMALKTFEKDFSLSHKVTPYFLDLLAYREVSNAISEKFNVEHQSPQLLLVSEGKCIYHASHNDIDALLLHKIL